MFESSEKQNKTEIIQSEHADILTSLFNDSYDCFKLINSYIKNFPDLYGKNFKELIERTNTLILHLETLKEKLNFLIGKSGVNNNNNNAVYIARDHSSVQSIERCLEILTSIVVRKDNDEQTLKLYYSSHFSNVLDLEAIFNNVRNLIESIATPDNPLDILSNEILIDNVMPLLSERDIFNLAQVNTKYKQITSDKIFWKKKIEHVNLFSDKQLTKFYETCQLSPLELYKSCMSFDFADFLEIVGPNIDEIKVVIEEIKKELPERGFYLDEFEKQFDLQSFKDSLIVEIKKYILEDRLDEQGQLRNKYRSPSHQPLSLTDIQHMEVNPEDQSVIHYFFNSENEIKRIRAYFEALNCIRATLNLNYLRHLQDTFKRLIQDAKFFNSSALLNRFSNCYKKIRLISMMPYQLSTITTNPIIKAGIMPLVNALFSPKLKLMRQIRINIEDIYKEFYAQFLQEHQTLPVESNLMEKLKALYTHNSYDDFKVKEIFLHNEYEYPPNLIDLLVVIYSPYNHREKLRVISQYCPQEYKNILNFIHQSFPEEFEAYFLRNVNTDTKMSLPNCN